MSSQVFLCDRCQRPYRTTVRSWHCFGCTVAAEKYGLVPMQHVGELSGC